MVARFEFESYWLSGRLSSIWIGGYMILIGVSNVVAIKIALRRSLVITSLIANILGLEIASLGGVIHIKLLWWENIYYWIFVHDDFRVKLPQLLFKTLKIYINYINLIVTFEVYTYFINLYVSFSVPKSFFSSKYYREIFKPLSSIHSWIFCRWIFLQKSSIIDT